MKYFTPELYLKCNSPKRDAAAKAFERWETALEEYRNHLRQIDSRLTPNTRKLARTLSLHDASFEGISYQPGLGRVSLRHRTTYKALVYFLATDPLIEEFKQSWPFSKEQVHWLYDEFDADEDGTQQHQILLSDGRIISMRFYDMALFQLNDSKRMAERKIAV